MMPDRASAQTEDWAATLRTQAAGLQSLDLTPENLEQGLARLVLGLVELLRQLLERQAIRRMEAGSLTESEVEAVGQALMTLETKLHELAAGFGLKPEDLGLDLGPLGKLT